MHKANLDVLVIGAGFAGAVVAERQANAGRNVRVIEKRCHIGGNAFDHYDAHGLLIHQYGPHIFHTQSNRVFAYLSRYTAWRSYEHRVLAEVDGQLYPMPINRTTINRLYGLTLDETGVAAHLATVAEPCEQISTSEQAVLASVGRDLCDKFFRGYTRKQWGLDLSELSASVAARIPTRTDDDDRYFSDRHQAMPQAGYTAMFQAMLDHPRITVETGVDYFEERACYAPPPHHLQRSCRWLFRLPVRPPALSIAGVRPRTPRTAALSEYRHGELSERPRLYPHNRIQVPDRAKRADDLNRQRVSVCRWRPLLSDTQSCQRTDLSMLQALGCA